MIDELKQQYDGIWIVLGVFDSQIGGFLRFDDRAVLTLYSNDLPASALNRLQESERLRCVNYRGHPEITLLDGYCSQYNSNGRIELIFRQALIGTAIAEEGEPVFDHCSVSLDHADVWSGRTGIEDIWDEDDQRPGARLASFERLTAALDGGSVGLSIRYSTNSERQRFVIETRESFDVETTVPISIDDLIRKWVTPLRYLICLAAGALPAVQQLYVAVSRRDENGRQESPAKLVSSYNKGAERERAAKTSQNLLVSLGDMQFDVDIPKWFSLVQKYGPACDLIFNRGVYGSDLINRFFNVATAVEAIHRKLFPDSGQLTAPDIERIDRLAAAVDETDGEWLREKLKFVNQPSYRARLEQLLHYVGSAAHVLVRSNGIGGPEKFGKAVVEYRNRIAHSRALDSVDRSKMYYLDLTLNALLRLVFLRELGWDEDRCHKAAMQHNLHWVN